MTMIATDVITALFAVVAFTTIVVGLALMILFTRAKFVKREACAIKINNNPKLTKKVKGGSTLLHALTSQGISIPSPCGGKATCLQCKVQIVEGAETPLETDKSAFRKRDLKAGWRLACQTKVRGDLSLHINEAYLEVKEFEGKVISNDNVATFIKELVVEIAAEIDYRPGDYLQFSVPPFKTNTSEWKETMDKKYFDDWELFDMFGVDINYSRLIEGEIVRAYSMASYPAEKKFLKFNIRIATPPLEKGKVSRKIPWGICSSYAFSLKPGDIIRFSGPFGESHMIDDDRELIFLIGGAGSSFGRSHIMDLFKSKKTKRRVTMWYGARSLKENIYEKEYRDLEKEHDNFTYHLVLSEPTQEDIAAGWPKKDPVKTAFLFRAFEEGQLKHMDYPEDNLYYVCGPPMHNKSVLALLDDYGVPASSIILDNFGS